MGQGHVRQQLLWEFWLCFCRGCDVPSDSSKWKSCSPEASSVNLFATWPFQILNSFSPFARSGDDSSRDEVGTSGAEVVVF